MPLPVFLIAAACVIILVVQGRVSSDLCIMSVVLAVCSYPLAEIGHCIPGFRSVGGAVILNTFLPSALVFYGLLPHPLESAITAFYKQSNFLYLFVTAVVVGSIFSMNRKTLLANIIKVLNPLAVASLVAFGVGMAVGLLCGLDAKYILFFILVPVMAGGVGEGAVPLATGYAAITHQSEASLIGGLLPIVAMANICAIVIAGGLHTLGVRKPALTGNGNLLIMDAENDEADPQVHLPLISDPGRVATSGLALITLYGVSSVIEHVISFPAPLIMLFLAIMLKTGHLIPVSMEEGARWIYRFFATSCTYPLMFCIGVVLTPWQPLVAAFSPAICITVACTVAALAGTGFIMARFLRMYPVEAAMIMVCHASSGGAGDVAILSAGERLSLMASAQVATKIGGFVTVTLALLVYAWLHH
ncbi:2-hydroxycarboxylate transporter family protein [Acetobacter sp. DmW_043]|uniref:2-hydroxycarboxylate transporter family protein n=1 Tax=Acetobacter sp. DmW_043 TaxID=1670658 RepID=UPI0013021CFF|nr:2-hydroxycarboxylate transporter family protein [Acetobacter sp. DmW_043]